VAIKAEAANPDARAAKQARQEKRELPLLGPPGVAIPEAPSQSSLEGAEEELADNVELF
jgi:hypothetical protein